MAKIIFSEKEHCRRIADLHIKGLADGFLSTLGIDFMSELYEAISEDKNSFCLIAIEKDKVLGFIAFSTSLSKLYKHVAFRSGLKFVFALARKLFSVRDVKKIIHNLLYPEKMKKKNFPDAELLSIVVAEDERGRGLARTLVERGLAECKSRDIKRLKVLVFAENEAANNLYAKFGFSLDGTIESYDETSCIYVISFE